MLTTSIITKIAEETHRALYSPSSGRFRLCTDTHALRRAFVVFAPPQDSTKLFVATLGGPVQILDLGTLDVQVLEEHVPAAVYEGDLSSEDEDESMDQSATAKKKGAAQLGLLRTIAVSHDQQYLAIGDELNHIWVYNLDTMRFHATLPTFAQTHLTFEFHPHNSSLLAVLCARNTLYLDVPGRRLIVLLVGRTRARPVHAPVLRPFHAHQLELTPAAIHQPPVAHQPRQASR
jgi:hypothetical protein